MHVPPAPPGEEMAGMYYDPTQDKYITNVEEDSDEDDAVDYTALTTDAFVVTANTEEENSSLQIHCYNEEDGNMYGGCLFHTEILFTF